MPTDPLPPSGSDDPTGSPYPPKPQPTPAAVEQTPIEKEIEEETE